MNTNIPYIEVGILFSSKIHFRLNGCYEMQGKTFTGDFCIQKENNNYWFLHENGKEEISLPIIFTPTNYTTQNFDLTDVVIGIQFHWERKEEQTFKGALKIIDEGKHLTAINRLPLEDYLLSVISSEMKATAPLEFLKAHAVISRSWLLAQQEKARNISQTYSSIQQSEEAYIRWYDREDHAHFDVCADDHCQRYQGISKAFTSTVRQAIEATQGEVLTYGEQICDARFFKCCGGATEQFENTWEPVHHPYLDKIIDADTPLTSGDLTQEEAARAWILSSPPTFCNTTDTEILKNVLNEYDQETQHFFRWEVKYTSQELSALVKEKLGIDLGKILELIPIERGVSGRLVRLKIVGSLKTLTIGKELVIRKAFSPTHLYSSAFVIDKKEDTFIFHGAGWGHGVGLCQIGAAIMGAKGFRYQEILQHYFKGSQLTKIY